MAQHDTEGGRFANVLQTTRVANGAQPSPSTEIKIGYQGIGCVRGGKAEEKALRHNATRRTLNHSYRGEICGHLEVHNRFRSPTSPPQVFPSGFKERLVVLCCIFSPSVGRCARPLTPARPVIKKQPILISVGGILPSLCISPELRSLLP